MKFIYLLAIFSIEIFNCGASIKECYWQEKTIFHVSIKHFYSGEGEIITWNITEKLLTIKYDCDFENCKEKILFSTKIHPTESQLYFDKIRAMQFNNLKSTYEDENLKDGLKAQIFLKNIYNKEVNIYIHGKEVNQIKDLYKLTDSLFLTKTTFKINK